MDRSTSFPSKSRNESAFVELFSRKGRARILDVLLQKPYTEMTTSQVIEYADISRSTFHRNIRPLLEIGLAKEINSPSSSPRYTLNEENEISKLLGQVRIELIEYSREINRINPSELPTPDETDIINKTEEEFQEGSDESENAETLSPNDYSDRATASHP